MKERMEGEKLECEEKVRWRGKREGRARCKKEERKEEKVGKKRKRRRKKRKRRRNKRKRRKRS